MAKDDKAPTSDAAKAEQDAIAQEAAGSLAGQLNARGDGPAGQTGPAQGFDPAVELPADSATDEEAAMIEEPTDTGPAQTPVHRQTDFVADPQAMAWEAENNPQPEVKLPKKAAKLTDGDNELLAAVTKRVLESYGREAFTDDAGRTWDVAYQVMNNQAVIVFGLKRDLPDGDAHQFIMATSALDSDDKSILGDALKAAASNVR